jgi:hypothetical protein
LRLPGWLLRQQERRKRQEPGKRQEQQGVHVSDYILRVARKQAGNTALHCYPRGLAHFRHYRDWSQSPKYSDSDRITEWQ